MQHSVSIAKITHPSERTSLSNLEWERREESEKLKKQQKLIKKSECKEEKINNQKID